MCIHGASELNTTLIAHEFYLRFYFDQEMFKSIEIQNVFDRFF